MKNKKTNSKLLLVMAYIRLNVNLLNKVNTTINLIVKDIGYTPDRHVSKINDMVKEQLQYLETNNHIFIDAELSKIKATDCFTITVNEDCNIFNMNYINDTDEEKVYDFVMLTYSEFEKITQTPTVTDKGSLLRVFLNIKKRINMDNTTKNWTWCSGDILAKECNVSRGYNISTPIKELCDMGILFEYKTGSYVDLNGNTLNAPNIYMLKANAVTKHQATKNMITWCKEYKGVEVEKFMPITKPNSKKKKEIDISEGFGNNNLPTENTS